MTLDDVRADSDWPAIEAFLRDCERAALLRVRDAEKWCIGDLLAANGARCLVGHACDCHWGMSTREQIGAGLHDEDTEEVEAIFDRLAEECGLAPVVACIQQRAGDLLDLRGGPEQPLTLDVLTDGQAEANREAEEAAADLATLRAWRRASA